MQSIKLPQTNCHTEPWGSGACVVSTLITRMLERVMYRFQFMSSLVRLLWSWPEHLGIQALIALTSALRRHFSTIVPSFLSSYQFVSTASDLSERHICTISLTFIQISIYPSIHSLSSATSKLHNFTVNSGRLLCCMRACFILGQCRIQAIHVNLVNAVLTGVSCNDIGCVLPQLDVIFQLSQQAYSSTAPAFTKQDMTFLLSSF